MGACEFVLVSYDFVKLSWANRPIFSIKSEFEGEEQVDGTSFQAVQTIPFDEFLSVTGALFDDH
jgi:hypothetical protein